MNQYIVFFQISYNGITFLKEALVTTPPPTLEVMQATKMQLLRDIIATDIPDFGAESNIEFVYTAPWMLLAE